MSNEIKEILEDVKRHLDYVEATKQSSIRDNEMKAMYDYITNLQEENERLKELNENASKVCMAEHRYGVDKAEEARDYKSRCEKAIEIIKIEKEKMGYAKNDSCLLLIEKALTGGDKE